MKNEKSDPIKWAQPKLANPFTEYKPGAHPQQHRIEEARLIPSLWTQGTYPKGK